jgi:hypothetical protein
MNPRTQTPADTLRAARALIAEKGWTQGSVAVDAAGKLTDAADLDRAACFCAWGAVIAVTRFHDNEECRAIERDACRLLARAIGKSSIGHIIIWNDEAGRTREEVLTAFDKAIALAETESARG